MRDTSQNDTCLRPRIIRSLRSQPWLEIHEGFQTAFKTRIDPGQSLSTPGTVYNTESGFVRTDQANLAGVGMADSATRVSARFTNVPAGTRIFVSTGSVSLAGNADIGTTTANAVLVAADATGAGGAPVSGSTTLNCTGLPNAAAAEVSLTSGSGVAVWEVTTANSATIDRLFFYMAVSFSANTGNNLPGLGQSSVAVALLRSTRRTRPRTRLALRCRFRASSTTQRLALASALTSASRTCYSRT